MKLRVLVVVLVLCMVSSVASAQVESGISYRKMWAVALQVTEIATGTTQKQLCKPRVAIIMTKDNFAVYSSEYQQYEIVSEPTVVDDEQEKSMTWLCVDQKRIPVKVTFGLIIPAKELQLQIVYSDYMWVYLLIP